MNYNSSRIGITAFIILSVAAISYSQQQSKVDLTENVKNVLPLLNGGTNQTVWTPSTCVHVNAAGTALESVSGDCGTGGGGEIPQCFPASGSGTDYTCTVAQTNPDAVILFPDVANTSQNATLDVNGVYPCAVEKYGGTQSLLDANDLALVNDVPYLTAYLMLYVATPNLEIPCKWVIASQIGDKTGTTVFVNGSLIGTEPILNFNNGTGTTWTGTDDPGDQEVNLQVDASGSGYTLQVGGSSLTSGDTVNFNNTTPVAGSNGINVHFQISRSSTTDSVSAEIVGDGDSSHFLNGVGGFALPAVTDTFSKVRLIESTSGSGTAGQDIFQALSSTHRAQMNNNNAGWLYLTGIATAGVAGNCPMFASNGLDLVDTGVPCGSGGGGSVASFTAGDLSPLFTSNVANPTTTPNLTFTLSDAAQNSVFAGPPTGGAGAPSFQTAPTISAANMTNFPTLNQDTTGKAAKATNLDPYTSYSVFGSGNGVKAWFTPTANSQCLMSAPSNYATTSPSFQTCLPSGANTALSNLGSVAINTALLPATEGALDFGAASKPWKNFWFAGGSGTPASYNYKITGTPTAARTITFPDASGTVAYTSGNVATATNLASYPTACTGSQFSQGLSSGSNNCAPVPTTAHACMIVVGADNGVILINADLGPQLSQCQVYAASTIVEIDVMADAGTPNVIVQRSHLGTPTALLSSALATAGSGVIACAKTTSVTGIDGTTTCTNKLQNTAISAGDWIGLTSGTAGGVAKRMSIAVHYTTP